MFLLGIVGSIFASFMYTLVHSNDSKILTRRSECNNCERKLSWFELIPIISYLYQRGKCNSCKERIPVIYLACEILLALLFLLPVIFQLQFDDLLMYYLLIIFLVPIALYDYETFTIPNHMSLILLVSGLMLSEFTHVDIIVDLVIITIFHIIYFLFNNSIGYGDIKLLSVITLLTPVNFILYTFLFTFIIGGLFILTLSLYKKMVQEKIPLAPFIVTSVILTFLIYEDLNKIYFGGFL